jgi:hypothetical protein
MGCMRYTSGRSAYDTPPGRHPVELLGPLPSVALVGGAASQPPVENQQASEMVLLHFHLPRCPGALRLTCWTRSLVNPLRSRQRRRRSSCSGGGALAIAHTRASPRLYGSNVLSSASPAILSVFARRRRRDVATEAGSTTWLSIPSTCSTR